MERAHGDRAWMTQAVALGALAEGTTRPNPRVGCLLVRDGAVVGAGYHRSAGGPHAEAIAVSRAGAAARGATAYVNLEPCSHHGATPPCADLLVAAGVSRVVAAIQDPNPLVDGKGFARLRGAGIEVEIGVGADEARAINVPFLHWHRTRRPAVTLKAAISLDGLVSAAGGASRWVTGEVARRVAHRLRLAHDAVLVGAGTVRADDPLLTVRLPRVQAPRIRAVLSAALDLDPRARLFEETAGSPRVRVYGAPGSRAEPALAARTTIVPVPLADGELDLGAVLDDLGRSGAQSVLVEGGGRTLASFLRHGLADRAALFVAPALFGALGATPLLMLDAVAAPEDAWRLTRARLFPLGPDLLVLGELARGGAASGER